MKKQIVLIHGGSTFETYDEYLSYLKESTLTLERITHKDWKDNLQSEIPEAEVLYLKMPNSKNARYIEWKIWFEKLIPLLHEEVTLVGHSLGGIFLAKYLAENTFPKKITGVFLVAPPYDTEHCDEPLVDFELTNNLELFGEQSPIIHLYQSKDDPAVPFQDAEKYKRDIPHINLHWFETRGHFLDSHFPELVSDIKNLI